MNRIKNFIILSLFFVFSSLASYSQNDCIVALLANDLSSSNLEFKTIVNKPNGIDAWKILQSESPSIRTDINELTLVSKNLEAIKSAKGYLKWKALQGVSRLDFSLLDITKALNHIKFRDLADLARRDIVGLHDAVEFNKLRITKALGNRNFQFPIGKTLDEVDEIVVLAEKTHPTIPGVKTIEYRVPSTDGKLTQKINGVDVNKGYTTGGMKGDGSKDYIKNIYDPAIWTDTKLEKALKESLDDAFKNKSLADGQFNGLTSEGYSIQGYIRNGKVETFYFY